MSSPILDEDNLYRAIAENPDRLQVALESAGWRFAGGRRDIYSRLTPPGAGRQAISENVVLPLDRTAPEFGTELRSAIAAIQSAVSLDFLLKHVMPRLTVGAVDAIQCRKETSSPTGLIRWTEGEELIQGVRSVLVAGAKAFMEPRRSFSQRYGTFANRYLSTVFMGQTSVGSYIVSAYAPAAEPVALRGTDESDPQNRIESHFVTQSVGRSLEGARSALDHYKQTGSTSGFVDQVNSGVSRELLIALKSIAQDADEASVDITWTESPDLFQEKPNDTNVEFGASDVPILERATNELAVEGPSETADLVGTVHFLSRKEVLSPGTIGLDVTNRDNAMRVRVRVETSDQYHLAVAAHDRDALIRARGRLQREGHIWWLYDAKLIDPEAAQGL